MFQRYFTTNNKPKQLKERDLNKIEAPVKIEI